MTGSPATTSGLLFALIASLLYATSVNIIPLAHAAGGSALLYLAMRGIFNFCGSFIGSRDFTGIPGLSQQHPAILIGLSISVAVQGYGYIEALHLLPISVATPLFFLFPILTYLLQKTLKRQKIHLLPLLLLATASFGIWLLIGGNAHGSLDPIGLLWVLIAASAQTSANVLLTRLTDCNSWQAMRASYLLSFLLFGGYFLFVLPMPEPAALGWTVLSASVFMAGSLTFLAAIKRLGAIRVSNVMYVEPITSVLISTMLHNDVVDLRKGLAIGLILGACVALETVESRIRLREQNVTKPSA